MHAILPTPRESDEAKAAVRALSEVLRRRTARAIRVRASDESSEASVTVPREAFRLFLEVLGHMAHGDTVTIMPIHAELTTQEAAELLNVSRPHLVHLIEAGKLPHRRVGTHRRIRASDLLDYMDKDQAHRKAVLDELTSEAEKHGLGY